MIRAARARSLLLVLALLPVLSATPARARHRGKPRPPVSVTSSLAREIPPDETVAFEVTISPMTEYSHLTARARAIGKVEVERSPELVVPKGAARAPVRQTLKVRVPRGGTGYIVIDVRFESRGRAHFYSKPFSIASQGSKHPLESPGRLDTDAEGRPIILLESTIPTGGAPPPASE